MRRAAIVVSLFLSAGHNAARGARRMTGTIAGRGLEGKGPEQGKRLDVAVSFDMDFSCGVK